jgi:hypothetical protein
VDLVVRFNSEKMDPGKPESVLQGINKFVVFNRDLDISNNILQLLEAQTPPAPGPGTQPTNPVTTVPQRQRLGNQAQVRPTTRQ